MAAGISCVEQPVPHADVFALAEIREQIGVPIMLDESLTSLADARQAQAESIRLQVKVEYLEQDRETLQQEVKELARRVEALSENVGPE